MIRESRRALAWVLFVALCLATAGPGAARLRWQDPAPPPSGDEVPGDGPSGDEPEQGVPPEEGPVQEGPAEKGPEEDVPAEPPQPPPTPAQEPAQNPAGIPPTPADAGAGGEEPRPEGVAGEATTNADERPAPEGGAAVPSQPGPEAPGAGAEPLASRPLEPTSAPARTPVWDPRYHTLEDVVALVDAWRSRAPEGVLVETLDLGESYGGLAVPALQFGRHGSDTDVPLEQRPTVLLLGGLDGLSVTGSEGVLAAVSGLLASPADLPPGVTFVAVPWAAPDGLRRASATDAGDGRNARPVDDDHDGAIDEDGPDDLDGDGVILDLLVQDPNGPWVRVPGTRFLAPARDGEAPRYVLVREGRDDDGDGRFNEDGPGGVCLDRNFPIGWGAGWGAGSASGGLGAGDGCGTAPLSEDLARRYADLALGRKTAAVLVLQGNHGGVARPGGTPADVLGWTLPATRHLPVFDRLAESFQRATKRTVRGALSLSAARGGPRRGAAVDWFYASAGALGLEVAVWGPDYERNGKDGQRTMDARYLFPPVEEAKSAIGEDARISAEDRRWAAWLDNTRGGLGFVDWHPVDLGGGRQGLVGGWKPRTRLNAPEEELGRTTAGVAAFVRELAGALPRLEIEVLEVERRGEICRLGARVRNRGDLPTGLAPGERPSDTGCVIELVLPAEAELLAGPLRTDFGHLPGAGLSEELEWLVRAPIGSTLRLRSEDRLTAAVEVEVQP